MFRLLGGVFFAIVIVMIVSAMVRTGRAYVMPDVSFERSAHPLRYRLTLSVWMLFAALCVAAIPWLIFQAATGLGPYRTTPIFAWPGDLWPFGVAAAGFGFLAAKMLRSLYRDRQSAAPDS